MKKISGIYIITNDINDKVYIGQSVNCQKRWSGHLYDSTRLDEKNGSGVDYAIKKYGKEHFQMSIIEEVEDISLLNEKEKYWINYYDSYKNGYNRSVGGDSLKGEEHPNAKLTRQDVIDIRNMYANHCKFEEVLQKYSNRKIQETGLKKIWKGETWQSTHMDVYTPENKEWHRTKGVGHSKDQINLSSDDRTIKQDEIDNIYNDFKNGLSITNLVKKYNRDYGVIQKYINNPIAVKKVKLSGRKVKNIETGEVFSSISAAARWAKCGATTLTRHLYDDKPAGKVPNTNQLAHWIEIIE